MVPKNTSRSYAALGVASVIFIACAGITYFLLTRIDLVVHQQLYYFGLSYSPEWADPYRIYMQLIYLILTLIVFLSSLILIFVVKTTTTQEKAEEPPKTKKEAVYTVEQNIRPQPDIKQRPERPAEIEQRAIPQNRSYSRNESTQVTCPKCNKTFTKPLSMLDFSQGKPKLVNVCPYCNSVLENGDN